MDRLLEMVESWASCLVVVVVIDVNPFFFF